MKQKFLYLFIAIVSLSVFLNPKVVSAKVEVSNLQEAIDEEIQVFGSAGGYDEYVNKLKEADLSNYKEDKNKVNVYLFRGSSCGHCLDAVVYFSSIVGEFGQYFNLKSYEVWTNSDNSDLMQKVANKLDDEADGVPYIVIGDKSWGGFTESYGDEMKEVIKEQYDKESKDRYDVMNKLDSKEDSSIAGDVISVIVILLVVGAATFGIVVTRKKASQ